MIVVTSQSQQIAEWVGAKLGHQFTGERFGIGLMDGGRIVAGVVFDQRKNHDIHGHAVAVGAVNRRFLYAIHHFPFVHLGVRRITACCRTGNEKSQAFLRRLGFSYEGCQRSGYPDGEDKMLFGQLKEECRWLNLKF